MLKHTKHNLKKVESLFQAIGYTIRYEKGNFQSGYCIVENRNIAVVNKFFDTGARMQTLIDILFALPVDMGLLDDKGRELYHKLVPAHEVALESE